jgi:PadR family transcriptional regulator, regulatory protein PadR
VPEHEKRTYIVILIDSTMPHVLYIEYCMNEETMPYERVLLAGWEDVYRKSQLSLFMLLALKDGPKHTAEIKEFILKATNGLQTTDEQSMYRALRRYHKAGMVQYSEVSGKAGPSRKRYGLTDTGNEVLTEFLQRNIVDIYYKPKIQSLINNPSKGISK